MTNDKYITKSRVDGGGIHDRGPSDLRTWDFLGERANGGKWGFVFAHLSPAPPAPPLPVCLFVRLHFRNNSSLDLMSERSPPTACKFSTM